MLSPVMEDYLKAIYQLGDDDVRTSELAEHLDVSQPTVTNTLEKLAERGLVEREKYEGTRLTEEGRTVAVEVVRHHRLLEADRLEHHISEEFEERVAAALGDPESDPHGAPIPNADLEPPDEDGETIGDCGEGDEAVVESVVDEDPEVLRYLDEHGIGPEVRLEVDEIAPFGMVTVVTEDGEEVSLPDGVAGAVRVRPCAKAEE